MNIITNYNQIVGNCVTTYEMKNACDVIGPQPLMGHEIKKSYDVIGQQLSEIGFETMYENETTVKRAQDKSQMDSKENVGVKYFYKWL